MTMAFVFCAFIIYVFWWDKPFDAEHTYVFLCSSAEQSKKLASMDWPVALTSISHGPVRRLFGRQSFRRWYSGYMNKAQQEFDGDFGSLRIKDLTVETGFQQFFLRGLNDNDLWPPIALYLTGAIFSAIHLVAWNWEFPSPLIQTLWRCFGTLALAMTLFPLSVALWGFIHEKPSGDVAGRVSSFVFLCGCSVYVLSRLALMGLTLYCFTSMPAGVYEPLDWTSFFPHYS